MTLAATVTSTATTLLAGISSVVGGGLGVGLLLVPGWVVARTYQRSSAVPWLSEREFVAATAFWGVMVHLLLLPWTIALFQSLLRDGLLRHLGQSTLWLIAVLYVVPTIVGICVGMGIEWISRVREGRLHTLLRRLRLSGGFTVADSWTWAWRQMKPTGAYVRVVLKDGKTTIVGAYGKDSVAGIGKNRDLYLQSVYRTTDSGWFGARRQSERGVWISGDQIGTIEYYHGSGGGNG